MITDSLIICEAQPEREVIDTLIELSACWEAENSCHGYRKNTEEDIKGNRIFLAREESEILGYLFGHAANAENASSVMPDGTSFFEVEELYIKPEHRSKGVGKALFACAEQKAKEDGAEFVLLSTATKNWKAIFHFYLDELGMEFWNARLFKKRLNVNSWG